MRVRKVRERERGVLIDISFFLFLAGARRLLDRATERTWQAYRPGTRANMRSHVLLYVAFTQAFVLEDFPATCTTLLTFAEFMLQAVTDPKSVLNALASLRHFHLDSEFAVEAFSARRLRLWRRALPLTCRHVPAQAPQLNLAMLCQLCQLSLRFWLLIPPGYRRSKTCR